MWVWACERGIFQLMCFPYYLIHCIFFIPMVNHDIHSANLTLSACVSCPSATIPHQVQWMFVWGAAPPCGNSENAMNYNIRKRMWIHLCSVNSKTSSSVWQHCTANMLKCKKKKKKVRGHKKVIKPKFSDLLLNALVTFFMLLQAVVTSICCSCW